MKPLVLLGLSLSISVSQLFAQEASSVSADSTRVQVSRSNGSHVSISWPVPDGLFAVESASRLDSTDWRSVSELISVANGSCGVTVRIDEGQRYFRLRTRNFGKHGPDGPGDVATNGYITAVLRSDCTSAPEPPPPVGETRVGPSYVIRTVADGDPLDLQAAQRVATDAVFKSLMPLYCGLPPGDCVTNRVQWNILTYDAGGNVRMSASPASGAGYHYCAVTNGFLTAIVRGKSAVLPRLPPVGQVAIGIDSVILTMADGDPTNLADARALATDAVFELLMRRYCALPRGTGDGQVSGRGRWEVATYETDGTRMLSDCAATGCDYHECVVSRGYITAVLRSDCTSAPEPPPPVGETRVGPSYVIRTVADGDPLDLQAAQRIATDAVFKSLMPLYCGLPPGNCVTNRVQWNILTYDAGGNVRMSASPTSGADYHYCAVTNGFLTAIVRGKHAVLPRLPPVGQVAIGIDSVILTMADGDPTNLADARALATDAVFELLMRRYCALPRGTGDGQVSGRARWEVATYETDGTRKRSDCAATGCDYHECVVSRGYITAVLRSDCTSAPEPPPPVGETRVGPSYVIRTVADGDPLDLQAAQRVATDDVFKSLMPLYCGLPPGNCVTNRVQWNILTYDAGGNVRMSAGPTSGAGYHYCP